ncbi:MAG: hypothetical protein H7240_01080 [Glaciimonas sp.]|nr:hypothetical protein [Glaciimonas sp.]
MRMVRNLAIDHYHRRIFELGHYLNEEEGYDVPSPAAGPEVNVILRTIYCNMFPRHWRHYPSAPANTFEMIRLRDYTLQETARKLEVSQTLVHFMVRDATNQCLNCVQKVPVRC